MRLSLVLALAGSVVVLSAFPGRALAQTQVVVPNLPGGPVFAPRSGVGLWYPLSSGLANPTRQRWQTDSLGEFRATQGLGFWRPSGRNVARPDQNDWRPTTEWQAGGAAAHRGAWIAPYPTPARLVPVTTWCCSPRRCCATGPSCRPVTTWVYSPPSVSNPRQADWRPMRGGPPGMWETDKVGVGLWLAPASGPRRPQDDPAWAIRIRPPAP